MWVIEMKRAVVVLILSMFVSIAHAADKCASDMFKQKSWKYCYLENEHAMTRAVISPAAKNVFSPTDGVAFFIQETSIKGLTGAQTVMVIYGPDMGPIGSNTEVVVRFDSITPDAMFMGAVAPNSTQYMYFDISETEQAAFLELLTSKTRAGSKAMLLSFTTLSAKMYTISVPLSEELLSAYSRFLEDAPKQ
jgi:hypothetical protein